MYLEKKKQLKKREIENQNLRSELRNEVIFYLNKISSIVNNPESKDLTDHQRIARLEKKLQYVLEVLSRMTINNFPRQANDMKDYWFGNKGEK